MRNLTFYIFDSRYSVPNINFAVLDTSEDGRSHAERLLRDSEHHTAVEVRDGDEVLLRLDRDGRPPCPAPDSPGARA